MEPRIVTRQGDGSAVALTRSELRAELEEGTRAAAARARAPELRADELDHLLDIFASRARFSAVDIGDEVVLSFDGSGTPQQGSRIDALVQYEQCLGADTCELYHIDYSYKAVKTIAGAEQQAMKEAQERVTIPVHYGAQPDLGRYSRPDGPCGNWSELLPAMRIDEARAAQEEAVELAVEDMVHVAGAMCGGRRRRRQLRHRRRRRRRRPPGDPARRGAPAREVPGHGHHGRHGRGGRARHARRARVSAARGWPGSSRRGSAASSRRPAPPIFGPAVNVNTSRTVAWNVARALTFMKPCMDVARIPVHANVGMGVGGVPMFAFSPVDAVSRCSRACVDILKVDGL